MPHKLLLADDSITIQRVIELTFADEDVQVLAVGDGKKAIASIQSDRPDIVLADVGMPERDGYEVAEFIKGNPQLANIPVLLLTGAFEPIDETRARAVGCDGVLVKPFEPQMVINRVKDLLAGRRPGGLWGNKTTPSPPSREAPPAAPEEKDASAQSVAAGSGPASSASLEDYFDRLDAAFASVEAATEPHGVPAAARSAPTSDIASGSSGLAGHDLEGWDPDLTGDPVRPAAVPPPAVVTPPAPAPAAATPPAVTPTIRFKPATPVPSEPPAEAEAARPAPPPAAAIPFVAPAPAPVAAPAPVPADALPAVATAVSPTVATAVSPVLEHREPPLPLAAPPADPVAPSSAAPIPAGPISLPSLAEAFATLLSAEQGRTISPSKVGASSISDQTVDEIVNRVINRLTDQSVRETVLNVAERLVREEIERIKAGR